MGYALRQGITFCRVGDRHVFLDLKNDRYFCLPPGLEAAFRDLVDGGTPDGAGICALVSAGVLMPDPAAIRPAAFALAAVPSASALDHQEADVRPAELLVSLWYVMRARSALKRRGLDRVMADLVRHKRAGQCKADPAGTGEHRDKLFGLAAAFERTARVLRSHDQCLSRSLALTRLCARRAIPAELVIGVRLRPFGAHAWVQSAEVLVNDRVDCVRLYTPIFAL